MPKQYTIEFEKDHLRVELDPDFSVARETRKEFWIEMTSACAENDTKRVLIEGPVPKGERESSEVIEAGRGTAAVPELWMAFNLEDFEPDDTSELFEAVAKMGGVRVRFFSERKKALAWLRLNAPR